MTMKEKSRLEVLWETREVTTISFKRGFSGTVFCQTCRTETLQLSVSESASILKVSEFAIFRFADTNQIHAIETGGMIRVCSKSLLALEQDRQIEN